MGGRRWCLVHNRPCIEWHPSRPAGSSLQQGRCRQGNLECWKQKKRSNNDVPMAGVLPKSVCIICMPSNEKSVRHQQIVLCASRNMPICYPTFLVYLGPTGMMWSVPNARRWRWGRLAKPSSVKGGSAIVEAKGPPKFACWGSRPLDQLEPL